MPEVPSDENAPTRYLGVLLARELLEFAKFNVHKFDIGVEELMILCCVVWNSTKDIVEEVYLTREFGYERNVLPTNERPPTSLKTIYTTLNMKRETARRKLVRLVDMGLVVRVKGGYVFPAQVGEADQTADLRKLLAKNMARLTRYLDRFRNL
jgi:hypothetical protein